MHQEGYSEQKVDDPDVEAFVEVDPSGRYGRYKEVLGKGAFKKVYRGFDEWEGIEVAWNQVKVAEIVGNSEDLERLYSEVHLLKTLKHKNIIKFYNSWVDTKNEHINFITEIFTSGTLRRYRKKHKHVDLRALKKWSTQILEGLIYLHSHDPPIIHRDLKCDNIFVNGNHGEVKIGDLGFAAILRHANAAHSVIGTPEFMAPELYEEEYNELVDIYAFGMCVLELVTFEYPYIECNNAAQIYKKVTSGVKPASLAKVKDSSVKTFIEKCIAHVSERLSAKELLRDYFLLSDEEHENFCRTLCTHPVALGTFRGAVVDQRGDVEPSRDYMVEGERKDVNTIFVKLRIADSSGNFRIIHFPFDIEADTSIAVASEMVEELDLTDQDVSIIADRIDSEIRSHIPDWSPRESFADESVFSEMKDDASPFASASVLSGGSLILEQMPSGRKFWLSKEVLGDFDQNTNSECVPGDGDENHTSQENDVCTESEQVQIVANRLGHLLEHQQQELHQLKLKHESAVSDILKELPHRVHCTAFKLCRYKIPDYRMHCERAENLTNSASFLFPSKQDLENTISSPVADVHLPNLKTPTNIHLSRVQSPTTTGAQGLVLRDRLCNLKRGSKHDLGIAVILKDDLHNS